MKTLMIEDLSVAKALDRREMSAVRGGTSGGYLPPWYPSVRLTDITNFNPQQLIGQTSDVVNTIGDLAFASDIHSTVNPTQKASNTINFL